MEPVLSLREFQTCFFRSIAEAPGPVASDRFDPLLLELVRGQGRLEAEERLDIYAQMYWARLVGVLREDFPRVAACLDTERFTDLTLRYLARYRSAHPSVRHVGARFAEFLASDAEAETWPFLPNLARLEWARLEVFDAPEAEPLRVAQLQAIPPADWSALTFKPIAAVQVLHSAWPVHEIWAAVGDGRLCEPVRLAETHLRIWRDGFTVYQASMDAAERLALEGVLAGESFAAVCEAIEPTMTLEDAPREAARLLLRWIEDGILARD